MLKFLIIIMCLLLGFYAVQTLRLRSLENAVRSNQAEIESLKGKIQR
jgi:hypothetical protein